LHQINATKPTMRKFFFKVLSIQKFLKSRKASSKIERESSKIERDTSQTNEQMSQIKREKV
jgi:hypothetical protein